MTQQFIVSVPGRAQPLCIEADTYVTGGFDRDGVMFRKGAEVVAIVPAVDLVAKADSLPAFPDLSQFKGPDLMLPEPACLASFAEPVRALEPLPAQTSTSFHSWGVPAFWPFLSGCSLGLLGGIGMTLSHVGVW